MITMKIDKCILQYVFVVMLTGLLMVFLLIGCTSTVHRPDPPTIKDTEIFDAPFEIIWNAVVESISENRYRIDEKDQVRGLLTTQTITRDTGRRGTLEIEDIAVRPSVSLGIWDKVRYSYTINITETGENITRVRILTRMETYERNVTKKWHTCYSRGILENSIFEAVKARL